MILSLKPTRSTALLKEMAEKDFTDDNKTHYKKSRKRQNSTKKELFMIRRSHYEYEDTAFTLEFSRVDRNFRHRMAR